MLELRETLLGGFGNEMVDGRPLEDLGRAMELRGVLSMYIYFDNTYIFL